MKIPLKNFLILIISLLYFAGINANLISWFEYKINYDFIVKFLCLQKDEPENLCHGSCHLKKNLEQNDEDKKPAEKPTREINGFNIALHFTEIISNPNKIFCKTQKYSSYITQNFQSNFIQPDSPPPKLV
jgi:hypothetical protein